MSYPTLIRQDGTNRAARSGRLRTGTTTATEGFVTPRLCLTHGLCVKHGTLPGELALLPTHRPPEPPREQQEVDCGYSPVTGHARIMPHLPAMRQASQHVGQTVKLGPACRFHLLGPRFRRERRRQPPV